MAEQTIPTKFKLRHDIASNWATKNPILLEGEVGFETDTLNFKIGDGLTNWNLLSYYIPKNLSQLQTDDNNQRVSLAEKTIWNSKSDFSGSYNDLTDKPIIPSTDNFVTTNTEQEITASKTFNNGIKLADNSWIKNADDRNIICKSTVSGKQITVGNMFDALVMASSTRPKVSYGLNQNESMAMLSDLPTKTSQLENDSNFATTSDMPTKTSQLTNDSGFATSSEIPTKTSEITNDSGFITASALPTKTSQLTNDSGFMTSDVVPSNFQPAPNHSGTSTTPPNDSVWTPEKTGWVMFSCTSHENGSEFYLKLNSNTGLMVGCSLGTGGGKMNYNNCPSMTLPVKAGKTYYVHYYGYSAHYYSS